jgi:PTH2 family peptidyl-tRNA hydrolase
MSRILALKVDEAYAAALEQLCQCRGIEDPEKLIKHLVRRAQAEAFPRAPGLPMKLAEGEEPLEALRARHACEGGSGRDPKQYLVVRRDLKVHKGKMVAQGAHGALGVLLHGATAVEAQRAVTLRLSEPAWDWLVRDCFKKIVLAVKDEAELLSVHQAAQARGLPCELIQDAGHTEFAGVPTYTALAIGPVWPHQVEGVTSHLPNY